MTPKIAPIAQVEPAADLQIALPDVARFVRQLSHDLRNHLNAAELQSAYLSEVAADSEVKGEIGRLRAMLGEMGASLQKLTGLLAPVKLAEMPYEAAVFIEDLRGKLAQQSPTEAAAIDWQVELGDAVLRIDPQIFEQALLELFANAFRHTRGEGRIEAKAEALDGAFTFRLAEPKEAFEGSTEHWGREPFRKVQHGHYGLGLPRVRSIVEAHHGHLEAHYDSTAASLVTTLSLPVAAAK
jgi:signal transduction histidine kinase